jgi:membrane protease YdiL (CAAX protease family)
MLLVLGVSLGQSAIYAIVRMADLLTRDRPLSEQTAQLNPSLTPRPWLDLTYQLLNIFFALVPVLLAWHLLNRNPGNAKGLLGIDLRRPGFDLATGFGLAALIGIPGLGLYVAGKALGITVNVVPAGLPEVWWAVPVLILAAAQNAILEEVVAVGYLFARLRDRWSITWVIIAGALFRGSYHLYQGFGAFVGNFVMGLIFGWFYQRWGRIMPLIIAHTLLDVVAFVGYSLFAEHLNWI